MGRPIILKMGAAALGVLLMAAAGVAGGEGTGAPATPNAGDYRALFPRLNLPETVRVEEPYRPGEWADIRIPIRNDGEGGLILRRVNTG